MKDYSFEAARMENLIAGIATQNGLTVTSYPVKVTLIPFLYPLAATFEVYPHLIGTTGGTL